MLTAIDGKLDIGGVDRFRIRIWNNDTDGSVVYDINQESVLGGGSVDSTNLISVGFHGLVWVAITRLPVPP